MKEKFYAGHSFKWMNQFLEATPKNLSKHISHSIACAMHHKFWYKKTLTFSLSHTILKCFGVNRKRLPIYLFYFKNAGLINVVIKKGKSPKITLLVAPGTNYSTKATSNLNNHTGVPNGTGEVPQIGQVEKKLRSKGRKQGWEASEVSKGTKGNKQGGS